MSDIMSGGYFDYKQYALEDISNKVWEHNPLLGEMLGDLVFVLNDYDMWLSDDSGIQEADKRWKQFVEKYFNKPFSEVCREALMKDLEFKFERMLGESKE